MEVIEKTLWKLSTGALVFPNGIEDLGVEIARAQAYYKGVAYLMPSEKQEVADYMCQLWQEWARKNDDN